MMEPDDIQMPALNESEALLKQYEQRKFALAEIIRSAQAIDSKDETLLSEARELLARLAEDRFNLLVVGRFSRGKSTLMNAILGSDYLPTGIVPLTSVITTVRYGSRRQVVLSFSSSGLTHEVPLSRLAEYVTQKENPANVKRVAYAEIQLPVELLRRGLHFVDSPGLGSPIIENSLTTERFLPQADAFVLVTSYESPLSEEEIRILKRIRNTNKRLFVVINKQDTVSGAERSEAMKFVSEQIEQFSFIERPLLFSISARQGLQAKEAQSNADLLASGLQMLEEALMRFLIHDRARSFLANMHERTMMFLAQRAHLRENREKVDAFRMLRERLQYLSEPILGTSRPQRQFTVPEVETVIAANPLVIDSKTGCRVCGAVLDGVFRFLSKHQYELTIDPETQRNHAQRGGFCQLHTWQYEGIASPQGVCESYPKLVHSVAGSLAELANQQGDVLQDLRDLLPTANTCRVCQIRMEAERQAIEEVVASLQEQGANANLRAPACCLPHLMMVVEMVGPGALAQSFLASHAALLERTAEDLERYALKHDALRRHLASEEERRASLLALLLLAGHRNVSSSWTIESII
jgi:GTPase Era involved in 16S rRNA processing